MAEPYRVGAPPPQPPSWPGPASSPPEPPPGPGVQPPFVAPPVEGRTARMWLGLGLAGAALLACCGVGVVAVGALLVLGQQAVEEQAHRAVTDYLAAVRARDWPEAYEQRCAADRRAESLAQFTQRVSAQPRIEAYEVRGLRTDPGGDLSVPVEVTYAGATGQTLVFPVEQNPRTGGLEVCGEVRQG